MKGISIDKFIKKNDMTSDFFVYMLGTILLNGISFLSTPIFTRLLTTSDYGITTVFYTWTAFFAVFIGLQTSGSIATARVHMKPDEFGGYMKSIVVMSLLSGLVIASVSIIIRRSVASLLNIDIRLIPHLLTQAFGMSCVTTYSVYTIQTKQPKKNVVFSILIALCTVVTGLFLVLSIKEEKFLGKIYGGTVAYTIALLYVMKTFIPGNKSKVSLSHWKYALALSFPLIIHLLSNIIIGQSDRLFLKSMIGDDAAGIYTVAYNIGVLGILFADVCNNIWSPRYLDMTKAGENRIINGMAKKYILMVCCVFIVVMLIAPEILKIMAPSQYWGGLNSLVIITAGVFFQYLYRFPLAYEQFSKNLKWVAVCTVASAMINMMLNYLFIKKTGLIGAAYATFLSYVILFGLHEFVARKIIKGYNIKFTTYLPGIVLCSGFAFIAIFLSNLWFIRYALLLLFIGTALLVSYRLRNK